jgi:hypothetical protein
MGKPGKFPGKMGSSWEIHGWLVICNSNADFCRE